MKKIIITLFAAASVFAAASCNKENGDAKPVNVTVQISDPEGFTVKSAYDVTLTSTSSSVTYSAQSENGVAVIESVIPGIYNVTASASMVDGGFNYIISAAESDVNILADVTIDLTATAVKESALVFKEIYTTGCKIGDGDYDTYFRDQFYEVYNNSNETVYADGLCFAITDHYTYDFSVKFEYDIENSNDYVYVATVWTVPGNGTDYPVKPGESIVFAQWATNHKTETLSNGRSPMDNTGAEFEFILGESTLFNGLTITDGPAINMERTVLAGYAMPQYLTSVSGCGYILFKPSKPLRTENFLVPTNYEYSKHCEVAIADVIDAVERIQDETVASTLQLPNSLDAGYIFASAPGSYTCESIVRKVKGTREDGTPILQDTNNTSDDFELCSTPSFRKNGAKIPSWNTWCK